MTAKPKSQVQKFREAARAIETDDSQERFDATLRRVAKHDSKTADRGDGDPSTEAKPTKEGR
jgi:hypothetical protein